MDTIQRASKRASSARILETWRLVFIGLFLAATSSLTAPAAVAGDFRFPEPMDDYVNDYADVLSAEDERVIREQFQKVEFDTGIELVMVTIRSKQDYGATSHSIEQFALELFNEWGVGHRGRNDGAMILVAVDDYRVRIQLGRGYGTGMRLAIRPIVNELMVPHFKEANYAQGLRAGAVALMDVVTEEVSWLEYHAWSLAAGGAAILMILISVSLFRAGKSGWGWAFLVGAGALIVFVIRNVFWRGSVGGFGGGDSDGGGFSGGWDFGDFGD